MHRRGGFGRLERHLGVAITIRHALSVAIAALIVVPSIALGPVLPAAAVVSTTVTLAAPTAAVRLPASITATVVPVPDGGLVTFTDEQMPIQGCLGIPVNTTTGIATCNTPYYSFPDQRTIGASFSGTDEFSGSTAANITLRIAADVVVTADANPTGSARPVVLTATVSPLPGYGTVTFSEGSSAIDGCATLAIPSSGIVTCPMTFFALGDHPITVDLRDIDGAVITRITHVQTVSALGAVYPAGTGSFTVPAGWADVRIEAWGAEGEQGYRSIVGWDGTPGKGGGVSAVVSASPGDRFDYSVGAQAGGGQSGYKYPGRGQRGGAATSVTAGAELLVVAGGGGGATVWAYGTVQGGDGGADTTTGAGQTAPNDPWFPGGGAVGAIPGNGGPGGTGDFGQRTDGLAGSVWADGGKGGTGGRVVSLGHEVGCAGGAGGGDGYAGGGGGGGCAGSYTSRPGAGGGGSSYFAPDIAGAYLGSGKRGDGSVSFSHAATQIVFETSTGPLGIGGTRTLTATLTDSAGTVVDTGPDSVRSITFAKTSGTGAVTGFVTVPAVGGVATATVTASSVGAITVTATASALPSSTQSFTITKASQTIDFVAPTTAQTFGSTFVVSPTATSGLAVQVAANGGCTAVAAAGSVTVTATSGTTACVLTATQAGDANRDAAAAVERTVPVAKAVRAIAFAQPASPAGFGQTRHVEASVSGGDAVTLTASGGCSAVAATGSGWDVLITSGTTDCVLTAGQAGTANYEATSVQRTVTVSKVAQHAIVVTGPETASYGQTVTYEASGGSGGADLVVSATGPACVVDDSDSDSDSVTVRMTTGTGTCTISATRAADGNYETASREVAVQALKLPASVNALAATAVYGDAPPALSYDLTGLLAGDDATDIAGSADCSRTPGIGVGAYTITCAPGSLSSPDYALSTGSTAQLTITRAPLRVTAGDASMAYGDVVPSIGFSYDGLAAGDTAPATSPTCAVDVPVNGLHVGSVSTECGGASDPNYEITYEAGTLVISPAGLIVTASSAIQVYGAAAPTITPSYAGFAPGDGVEVLDDAAECTSGTSVLSGVGAYSSACSGASAGDYAISYVAGSVTVVPATLTVTASSETVVYGDGAPPVTPAYEGFVNGDGAQDLLAQPECSATIDARTPVGTHSAVTSCEGGSAADYSFDYVSGEVTVTPAELTITASDGSAVYGATAIAITPSYDGFVAGEGEVDLTTAPDCRSTSLPGSHVGSYDSVCNSASSSNYTITYKRGTVTITRAPLTITASDASQVYGDAAPAITAEYAGFVAGDDWADLDSAPECRALTTETTPAGVGASRCDSAASSDYDIAYAQGVVTVTPAPLTVTASDTSHVYGSPAHAVAPRYSGWRGDDGAADLASIAVCSANTIPSTPVGEYESTCAGAAAANYAVTYVAGSSRVSPAELVVAASSGSHVYGTAGPVISPTITGYVNGEDAAALAAGPVCVPNTDGTTDVGTYSSTCAGVSAANYVADYVPGVVSVSPAPLVIRASDATRAAGASNPAFIAVAERFVAGDGWADLEGTLNLSTVANGASAPGQYYIVAGGVRSPNYTIVFVDGTLTVTAAPVVPDDVSRSAPVTARPGVTPESTPSPAPSASADPAPSPTAQPQAVLESPSAFAGWLLAGAVVVLLLIGSAVVLIVRRRIGQRI